MFGAARPINVYQTKAEHRDFDTLRSALQNLTTFCFAIILIGLALTLACASTLFTSDSHVWGLSKLPHLCYGVMVLAPLRSPITNMCRTVQAQSLG